MRQGCRGGLFSGRCIWLGEYGSAKKEPNPASVLAKAFESNLSAKEAAFGVLAEELGVQFVTSDQQVINAFPILRISPENFVRAPDF